jgi:hypothetical protein
VPAKSGGVHGNVALLRLDLIQKMKLSEEKRTISKVQMIQRLAIEEKIEVKAAKRRICVYLWQKEEWNLPEAHRGSE